MKIQEAVCALFVFALLAPARGFGKTIYTGDLEDKLFQAVCEKGSGKKVAALIGQGANLNGVDYLGTSPLMRASSCGNLGAVKILVKNGADVNLKDEYGSNALRYAVVGDSPTFRGTPTIVKFLLDHGSTISRETLIEAFRAKGPGKATGKDGTSIGYICDALRKSGISLVVPELPHRLFNWMFRFCDSSDPYRDYQSADKASKVTHKQLGKAHDRVKHLLQRADLPETPAP
jgi:hypothetical protein